MSLDIFIATPLYDGKVCHQYMAGVLQTMIKFGPQRATIACRMGSFLPRVRDLLTTDFLESGARYMLSVDADIGFSVSDVERLIDSDRGLAEAGMVGGLYAIKSVVQVGVAAAFMGETDGALKRCHYLGAGFLLLRREVVLQMAEHYKDLAYPGNGVDASNGMTIGLWNAFHNIKAADGSTSYIGEDYSFCKRWTDMGGKIWADPRPKLQHIGTSVFMTKEST